MVVRLTAIIRQETQGVVFRNQVWVQLHKLWKSLHFDKAEETMRQESTYLLRNPRVLRWSQ